MVEVELISKKYLRKIDKDVKMIPLTFDVVFKGVFERNLDILKRFLISTLELEIDANSTKIEILNNELIKENTREYQKRIDMLVVLNDTIYIDIEINRSNFEGVKLRNSMYCDKLYSMLLDIGDKTTKLKDIYLYQLNLNAKDKSITYGEDKIVSFSLVTKDIFIKNKFMVLKYLEFYRDLYYTNLESLSDSEIWLASLTASNFLELNEMLSNILNDKDKNRLVKEAIRMSKWTFNLHEWNKEKMDELVRDETERINREERERAVELAINEGIEQGREEGSEQTFVEMVNRMIKNEFDEEMICKVTGRSIEDIRSIVNNLKN